MCEHSNLNSRKLISKLVVGRGYVVLSPKANLKPRYRLLFLLILIEEILILFVLLESVCVKWTTFSQLLFHTWPASVNRVVSFWILFQSWGRIPRMFGAEYISNPTTLSMKMSRPRKWGHVTNNSTILLKNIGSNSPYIKVDISSRIPTKTGVIIIIISWRLFALMKIHIKTIRLTCLNCTWVSPEGLQRWR